VRELRGIPIADGSEKKPAPPEGDEPVIPAPTLSEEGASGGRRGPPEAPCAAQQCGNGAPAPLVSVSTDFPNEYG